MKYAIASQMSIMNMPTVNNTNHLIPQLLFKNNLKASGRTYTDNKSLPGLRKIQFMLIWLTMLPAL